MRQYATEAELAAYPGGDAVPTQIATTVLVAASGVVDRLLRGVVYDVDADKLPTDPTVAAVLRDAACSIAVEAHATGVLDSGATSEWKSASIGSVSLSERTVAEGAVVVDGWPVPPLTVAALTAVGTFTVYGA